MFNHYDHDKSGTIDVEEFRDAFVGKQIASETWDEMIKEVDEDQSGQISFDEFKNMMKNLLGGGSH